MPEFPTLDEGRTRSILDPIHGLIRLTPLEMRVVDHPLFQRLRAIKQNGLLLYVFPAATHTRFEHSLGVLYVTHGMLNSLVSNAQVGVAKGNVARLASARSTEAVDLPHLGSAERNFLYGIARLAALSHDLGHGPLSHTFDSFAPSRTALAEVLTDPALRALEPLRSFLLEWGTDDTKPPQHVKNRRVPHEVMSCVFFTKIWHDLGEPSEVAQAVTAAILGGHNRKRASDLLESATARAWLPLIHDIVASAPADADRMDYMERDSRAVGVTYGLFDRNRILKSLLPYKITDNGQDRFRLGIKRSGLQAIENLMQARYELFTQIYYHKTNRAIGLMLNRIAEFADEDIRLFDEAPALEAWITIYKRLGDEYFLRFISNQDTSERNPSSRIRDLAERIEKRHLWKRILEPTTDTKVQKVLDQLHAEFPDDEGVIKKDAIKPRALKDIESGAALLVRNREQIYVAVSLRWQDESTVIKGLADAENKFVRIYYEGSDSTKASRIRERALQTTFQQIEADHASH